VGPGWRRVECVRMEGGVSGVSGCEAVGKVRSLP
jgi:hypothetical protein